MNPKEYIIKREHYLEILERTARPVTVMKIGSKHMVLLMYEEDVEYIKQITSFASDVPYYYCEEF